MNSSLLPLRPSAVTTSVFSLPQQHLKNIPFNPISVPLPKEEIELHFSYPKPASPDLISPLFGVIIPFLMIIFNRKINVETEPETPCPRYLDLKACIRKMKQTLNRIKPLLDELTQLEGEKSQKWNQAVYEDYKADLDEQLRLVQSNRGDNRVFFTLEQDIPYFVAEIQKEHRLKFRGKDQLLNIYRLFSRNNSGAIDQSRSFVASYPI